MDVDEEKRKIRILAHKIAEKINQFRRSRLPEDYRPFGGILNESNIRNTMKTHAKDLVTEKYLGRIGGDLRIIENYLNSKKIKEILEKGGELHVYRALERDRENLRLIKKVGEEMEVEDWVEKYIKETE